MKNKFLLIYFLVIFFYPNFIYAEIFNIESSEIKISVLINKKDSKKALAALHKEFKLDK